MKPVALCIFLMMGGLHFSVSAADDSAVVVERGSAQITLADIDGRMSRLISATRPDFAHRPENLARMMDQLLLNRQLAIEARADNLDDEPDVKRDLELAVEEVLAIHRLNRIAEQHDQGNLEQLARERYMADPTKFQITEQRVVEHVLVSTEKRTDGEALEIANRVRAEAMVDGSKFPDLVQQYSDDSGKAGNKGRYTIAQSGQYVPEFEAAARSLANVGDVSEPVKTTFGYHVIRLVELRPEHRSTFEEVKDQMVADLRETQLSTIRDDYKKQLKTQPEKGNEELLRSLPDRYHAGKAAIPPGMGANEE